VEANAAEEIEVAQEDQEGGGAGGGTGGGSGGRKKGEKKSGTLGWGRLTTYQGGCRRG
jgi:hypothetical protein